MVLQQFFFYTGLRREREKTVSKPAFSPLFPAAIAPCGEQSLRKKSLKKPVRKMQDGRNRNLICQSVAT